MSTYLEKVKAAEDVIAGEIVEQHLRDFSEAERAEAWMLLGRAQAIDHLAVALSAKVIRFLEHFEITKLYRALGFDCFADFLNGSGLKEVTKNKYYDRKKAIDKEGDPTFDALNAAGVPLAVRALLQPGDVHVEGETLIIRGETDADDVIIHRDDPAAIVETIRNLASTRRSAAKEAANLKEKLKDTEAKHDAEKRELYDDLDREKARQLSEIGQDGHTLALTHAVLAISALRKEIEKLSGIDRAGRRDNALEQLAHQMQLTAESYGARTWVRAKPAEPIADGEELSDHEFMERGLDQVFADMANAPLNDAELAAKMK